MHLHCQCCAICRAARRVPVVSDGRSSSNVLLTTRATMLDLPAPAGPTTHTVKLHGGGSGASTSTTPPAEREPADPMAELQQVAARTKQGGGRQFDAAWHPLHTRCSPARRAASAHPRAFADRAQCRGCRHSSCQSMCPASPGCWRRRSPLPTHTPWLPRPTRWWIARRSRASAPSCW